MEFIDLITQKNRIKKEIMDSIESVIDRGHFILGEEVVILEKRLAEFTKSKFCIANANGTDALVLALRALEIGPGDEVIVPAFTFFATAEAVSLVGATPIFVDINRSTYNIEPGLIEAAITTKTKAIIPVSLYGLSADFKTINQIASKHNLAVIEDAAQSFGAKYFDQISCGITTISTTSFFPSKPLGCYGDGGALFTNNEALAKKILELRAHGQEKRYTHVSIGYNSRMDTIQAAILLKKLDIFPSEIEARHLIAQRYSKALEGKFKMQTIPSGYSSVFAQFTLEVNNRDEFQNKLKEAGIPTAIHYPIPLHHQPVYKEKFGHINLPESVAASARVVSLPMHPYLDHKTQDFIIENVIKFGQP
ncbi:MAG: DegT/DnrJ/EryC1/StrS family aminotransferase [Bacteriovorax sp.]|nr:DegT/DnrJ/EryC1/StrS family aminotransferase [Bacteriovorax sp.]